MSRPVAGVRKQTVILTLPGSPVGAKENLQSVLKLLPHACQQAAGVDSRSLHRELDKIKREAETIFPISQSSFGGYSYSCEHIVSTVLGDEAPHEDFKSNNSALGPINRNRISPYPMVSITEALELIKKHSFAPRPVGATVGASLVGYVLAEDVTATEAVPAYRASTVDGYAVVAPQYDRLVKGVYTVISKSTRKFDEKVDIGAGQIARITTGAPLPKSANAVVMVENTVLRSISEDGCEEKEVEILAHAIKEGDNVREVGSDIQIGNIILKNGEQISAAGGELGLLASIGKTNVTVYDRPIVGVLSTGDEIVEHSRTGSLKPGMVRDCNRPTIIAAVQKLGFHVVDLKIAKDNTTDLEQVLRDSFSKVDLIITTGGVSMGEHDLLKSTIERALGGTIHFGRVLMKPGKPTTFATIPVNDNNGELTKKLIFSLPGNPVSALVTLHIFVLPLLQIASGISPVGLPKVSVILENELSLDPQRPEFHRSIIFFGKDGLLHAISTGGQRSSRVGSLRMANGLLLLPAGSQALLKGERVEALLIGNLITHDM